MGCLGNLLWVIFCGWELALGWFIAGLLSYITIIGIPVGMQCFKIAFLALLPFGRTVEIGGSTVSFLANIIWIIFCGWELALGHVIAGCLCCITVIGIPFGLQNFKLARLALFPFGAIIN